MLHFGVECTYKRLTNYNFHAIIITVAEMVTFLLGISPKEKRKEDEMFGLVRNDKVVSLAHEVARAALWKHRGGADPRWISSETKVREEENGTISVRIRAEVVLSPTKPGGDWVTISTTVEKKDKYTYFPGPTVTLKFRFSETTYEIRSIEGSYRHLEWFEVLDG